MYSELLSLVQTTDDRDELINSLGNVLKNIYGSKEVSIEDKLNEKVPDFIVKKIIEINVKNNPTKDFEATKELLESVVKQLEEAREIHLTIAFRPTHIALEKVSYWFKQTYGADFVLNITFDPEIIAGAVVVVEGKYTDLSLKSKLVTLFAEEEKEIMKQILPSQ